MDWPPFEAAFSFGLVISGELAQGRAMSFLAFFQTNARWLSAGALLTLLSSFGQTYFISLFAVGIRSEFHLSHGEWGAIYATGTMVSAATMVWAGALSDVIRVRVLGVVSLCLLALACFGMSVIHSASLLTLVVFGLRLSGQGMLSHIARVAMARWFVAARGRALAVAALGFSFGEALLPIIVVACMPFIGWRNIWVIAGVVALAFIPVLLRLLRVERTPQAIAAEQSVTGMGGQHWRRRDALRHPLFWMCVPALTAPSAFGTALFFHQVHLAEVKGWQHIEFVSLIPVYTVTGIAFMFIAGWAVDRWGSWRLFPFTVLPFAAGLALLWASDSQLVAAFGFVFFGIMQGANSAIPSAFWAEVYGTRHVGAIKALSTAVMVLGSAIGPGLTGWIIDRGVDFNTQLIWIAAYVAVVALIAWLGVRMAQAEIRLANEKPAPVAQGG